MSKSTSERAKEIIESLGGKLAWWSLGEKCDFRQIGTAAIGEDDAIEMCSGYVEPDCDPEWAEDPIPDVVDVFAESESQHGGALFELTCLVPDLLAELARQREENERLRKSTDPFPCPTCGKNTLCVLNDRCHQCWREFGFREALEGAATWLRQEAERQGGGRTVVGTAFETAAGGVDCLRSGKFSLDKPAEPFEEGHPENRCNRCCGRNVTWHADNDLWNGVMGDSAGILCPLCFIEIAESKGVRAPSWRLSCEDSPLAKPAETEDPDDGILGTLKPIERHTFTAKRTDMRPDETGEKDGDS